MKDGGRGGGGAGAGGGGGGAGDKTLTKKEARKQKRVRGSAKVLSRQEAWAPSLLPDFD